MTPTLQSAGRAWNHWKPSLVVAGFLLPAMFFLVVFIAWPIADSLSLSLVKWNGVDEAKQFVGLANWRFLLQDDVFWSALRNNVTLVVLSIAIQLPIAMALAVLLDRGGRRLRLFRTVYFLPMLMSSVAIGILFKYAYDPVFGIVNPLLSAVGLGRLTHAWLGDPSVALFSVVAVICWQYIPFYMILFLAALTAIPQELHEAAVIDGATEPQYFRSVEMPMLSGTIRAAAILSLIGSLHYFDLVWVMTEGGPTHATELMATYVVKKAFQSFDMGYGNTVASAMFVITMAVALILLAATRRRGEATQ
jgi:raffinose/stachyose/melibiose transport system permease protein